MGKINKQLSIYERTVIIAASNQELHNKSLISLIMMKLNSLNA